MSDEAIKTVAGEITKIAVEHGYNGTAPKTITGAIDALADTLAGSDVDSGNTVAQAVRALAPYVGSGGGGFEPKGLSGIMIGDGLTMPESEYFLFKVDSRGPMQSIESLESYGNVYQSMGASGSTFGIVGGGLYVVLAVAGSNGSIDANNVAVEVEEVEMAGVTKFTAGDNVLLTFQVPEDDQDAYSDIYIHYDNGGII